MSVHDKDNELMFESYLSKPTELNENEEYDPKIHSKLMDPNPTWQGFIKSYKNLNKREPMIDRSPSDREAWYWFQQGVKYQLHNTLK